jgi:hypothetical protein
MTISTTTELPSTTPCGKGNDELPHAALALFDELRGSLETSTKAVLQRDLAALEQATGDQRLLLLRLRALLPAPQPANSALPEQPPSILRNELCDAGHRVLQLARVQAALLKRARRFATVLSNLLASPQRSYAPSEFASGTESLRSPCSTPGDGLCRP